MKSRIEKNKKIQKEITKEETQKKLKKISKVTSIILIIILSTLCYGMFIGAKVTLVHEYKVTNTLIPSKFHGIKIVHISDLLFNSLNYQDLKKLKTKINELDADILVFTGDIKKKDYTLSKENIKLLEDFFGELHANLEKYAVIGDCDDDSFSVIMENSHFKVLQNKAELFYYQETTPIQIVGIDSNSLEIDTIDNDYYSICLLHNPDKIEDVLKKVNCNLALAGDTLLGEIKVPFTKGIFTHHIHDKNYYKIKDTELYISNGLGNTINMRLFNHPSINLYRLTKY